MYGLCGIELRVCSFNPQSILYSLDDATTVIFVVLPSPQSDSGASGGTTRNRDNFTNKSASDESDFK